MAKLEPQEGCPVEEGLIVKVGFGKATIVWKQSLLDLSGGQRSLIALSLVALDYMQVPWRERALAVHVALQSIDDALKAGAQPW